MGKIKTKLIKRTGNELVKKDLPFSTEFTKNKQILGREMPSKKVRNQIAGYLVRLKQQQAKKEAELAVGKK